METRNLYIEPTAKTPQFDFNQITGELILSGKSKPENTTLFFEKALDWVKEYIKNPKLTTNLRLNLEYFNTSSTIWVAKIIKLLCSIKSKEFTLLIHMYFDIEEYEEMNIDDVKDALSPLFATADVSSLNLGIKMYGTDKKGEILKESIVLL